MDDIYVMHCGCRLYENQLIKIRTAKACPEHLQKVKHVIRKCLDCPEIMELQPTKIARVRCEKCAKIHAKELRRVLNAERRARKKADGTDTNIQVMRPAEKACGDRWDCIHRRECFDDAIKSGRDNKPLPCAECERYEARKVV